MLTSPSELSAQTGLDRAAAATARAEEEGAAQNSHAQQDVPAGVLRRFAGQTLPPGIRRTRPQPTEPDPEPTEPVIPDAGTPVCLIYQTVVSGFSVTQVCVLWGTL
jgi:hypothetical protein